MYTHALANVVQFTAVIILVSGVAHDAERPCKAWGKIGFYIASVIYSLYCIVFFDVCAIRIGCVL
jgi:hypothetical protein